LLNAIDTENINRPEYLVLTDYAPGAHVANVTRLAVAYDPWIRTPPPWETLLKSPSELAGLSSAVDKALASPSAYGIKLPDKTGETDWFSANMAWVTLAEALGFGGTTMGRRARLTRSGFLTTERTEETLMALNGDQIQELGDGDILGQSTKTPLRDEELALIRLFFALDWARLIEGGYFEKIGEAPAATRRQEWARMMRAQRLSGIFLRYLAGLRAFTLRPYARLLQQKQIRDRAILEWGATAEPIIATIEKAAALPIHRILASADAAGLPGRASTPWASASPVLAVPRRLLTKIKASDDVLKVFEPAYTCAKALLHCNEALLAQPEQGWSTAETALGLVSTGVRPALSLFGRDLLPVHSDGMWATSTLSLSDLAFRPILPTTKRGGVPWISGTRVIEWRDHQIDGAAYPITVAIEPEDPGDVTSFALKALDPRAIKRGDRWQGDIGTTWLTSSPEAIARFWGTDLAGLKREVASSPAAWAHVLGLFDKGGQIRQVFSDTDDLSQLTLQVTDLGKPTETYEPYLSERTRRYWLKDVAVRNDAGPTEMVAMQYGKVMSDAKCTARFVTDMTNPNPTIEVATRIRDELAQLVR
jgi:hypothetical protein